MPKEQSNKIYKPEFKPQYRKNYPYTTIQKK